MFAHKVEFKCMSQSWTRFTERKAKKIFSIALYDGTNTKVVIMVG